MTEKITHISEAFGWQRLDLLLSRWNTNTAVQTATILHHTTWPNWFEIQKVRSLIEWCYKIQADSLWFSTTEIETFWSANMLALCNICQNTEWGKPNVANVTWGFLNTFHYETAIPNKDLVSYIQSLFDRKHTHISLYPHRMDSMEEFVANIYHEVTHHLIAIRVAQVAIKKWKTYEELYDMEYIGELEHTSIFTIVHETLAHIEWGQRIVNINPHEAQKQAGWEWWIWDSNEVSAYHIGSNFWFIIYRMQIWIFNALWWSPLSKKSYMRFEKWCRWIRREILEAFFEPERLLLIGSLLNTYENNHLWMLVFYETNIQNLDQV